MADRGGEFSIFQGINVRFDMIIDISISVRPKIIKLGKQVHLKDLTQIRLIKQVLVTSLRQDHVTNGKHYISTTRVPMANKLGMKVTYLGLCP